MAALLGLLTDPRNPVHLAACLRGPAVGLSDATLVRLALPNRKLDARVLAGGLPAEALAGEADRWRRFLEVARRLRSGIDRRTLVDSARGRLGGARDADRPRRVAPRRGAARKPRGGPAAGRPVGRAREVGSGRLRAAAARPCRPGSAHRARGGGGRPGRASRPAAHGPRCQGTGVAGGVHRRPGREPPAHDGPAPGGSPERPRLSPDGALERRGASDAPLGGAGRGAREPRAGREPPRPLRGDDPGPRSPRPLGHPGQRRATRVVRLGRPGAGHARGPPARPPCR